jgi:very-short-patch-repair endonuclease
MPFLASLHNTQFAAGAYIVVPIKATSDALAQARSLSRVIDGCQDLGDPDAYRRDRRKDALLQENGYLVLRLLAEDVGKYLDQVLDAILRALSHQGARI